MNVSYYLVSLEPDTVMPINNVYIEDLHVFAAVVYVLFSL